MIRTAKLSDAKGIAKVHVETWQKSYAELLPSEFLSRLNIAQKITNWELQIKDEYTNISVYKKDGLIRGFIAGGCCRDEDLKDYSEVYAIYVSPTYQSQGIGKVLMSDFLKSNSKPISLWVLSDNENSIGFYISKGFVADGSTKSFSISGENFEESRYIFEY